MKIIFTEREIKAGVSIANELIESTNTIAKVVGDTLDTLKIADLTDEDIAKSNNMYKGIVEISRADGNITIDINEEFVVESCDLFRDFIIDFYDVLKYGVKTLKAFAFMSLKPFQDKWQKLISKNIMKG